MDIKGKVAIVTGAGSGIGRATALRLAKEGASIVVVDIDAEVGHPTAHQIDATGGKAAFCRADVTVEKDVRNMIDFAETKFGGLDIVHNNAGIITGVPRWLDTEPSAWIRMLDINLRGVILGTQLAIQSMTRRGVGGAIVNTASLAGIGYGFPPNPFYAASKGGVVLFTTSLAPLKDEAGIRVNCVCPGVVDTPMLRGAREAQSDEQAEATRTRLTGMAVLQPEEIADVVVEFIRDDSLAGRAMLVPNGRPRELIRVPTARPLGL